MRRCGGPGAGKSMRAKRLQVLLADGWIKGSGSSSAKAGMNGGMDHLCGRLVYAVAIRTLYPTLLGRRPHQARGQTSDIIIRR